MKIRVLGAAAGGGFPQWNCNCRNCDGVRKGNVRATAAHAIVHRRQRRRASNWVLFNASPDLLAQYKSFRGAAARTRHARYGDPFGIVLMDAQIDHTTGLLMLREGTPARNLLHRYGARRPEHRQSAVQDSRPLLRRELACRFRPNTATAFPVIGARGAWLHGGAAEEQRTAVFAAPRQPAPGRQHRPAHRRPALRTRCCSTHPAWARSNRISGRSWKRRTVLMVDGTFWTDDEMIRLGLSKKRAPRHRPSAAVRHRRHDRSA